MKFIDFYNEHTIFQYDIGRFYRKNPNFFLVNRPLIGLKDAESSWKTTKILPFSNIYFRLPRYIDSSISAECLKAKSVELSHFNS